MRETDIFVRNKEHNTFPIIHHCPEDMPNKIWFDLERIRGSYSASICKPDDLTIITFNNTPRPMLLEKRLNASNTEYLLLGKEVQPWTNPAKIDLLVEHLPKVSTKYVLVMDDIDVIISSNIGSILQTFHTFDCKVLYNSSSVIYPKENKYSEIETTLCDDRFRHLNSGCFIGYTDYCLELYREALAFNDAITTKHYHSDQIKLKAMYVAKHPEIRLDSKARIFQVWNVKGGKCEDILEICYKSL